MTRRPLLAISSIALLRRGIASAALLAVATGFGLGCQRPPLKPAENVAIFALDAGTWDLLDPFIERGLLPNLARLRAAGTTGRLQSLKQSSSPIVWTSIATGKTSAKHGITSFVRFPTGERGKPSPVSSTLRQGKAFWNILGERGYDVAVVGWFVTWPVEAINGRMISDRAHWGAIEEQGSFPPAYLADLQVPTVGEARAAMPRFMDFDYDDAQAVANSDDPGKRLNYLVFDRFIRAYIRDLYYVRAAERILADGPLPKIFALYLRGTDDVQHGFWKFMDPNGFDDVPPEQVARLGKVIERYWQWTDEQVGRILAYYEGKQPLVLVLSDHGAGPAIGEYKINVPEYLHLSGAHREQGVIIAAGPGIGVGKTLEGASIYDVLPSLLYYLGLPVGGDMDGKVLTDLFVPEIAERAVATVPTYDDPAQQPKGPTESSVDEKEIEHLRSLGYID